MDQVVKMTGWRKKQIANKQRSKYMTKDEALKLSLEAFDYIEHNYMSLPTPATKAITAIKEALAQPPEERNFCPRCGKRAGKNAWDVHTCSLPEEKNT